MTRKHMGRLNKNIECVKARESSLDSDRIELFYLMIKYAEAEPSSRYELAVKMCDIKEKIRVKTSIIAKHIAVNQTIKIGK